MTRLLVNPELLEWARERSGSAQSAQENLAARFKKLPECYSGGDAANPEVGVEVPARRIGRPPVLHRMVVRTRSHPDSAPSLGRSWSARARTCWTRSTPVRSGRVRIGDFVRGARQPELTFVAPPRRDAARDGTGEPTVRPCTHREHARRADSLSRRRSDARRLQDQDLQQSRARSRADWMIDYVLRFVSGADTTAA